MTGEMRNIKAGVRFDLVICHRIMNEKTIKNDSLIYSRRYK